MRREFILKYGTRLNRAVIDFLRVRKFFYAGKIAKSPLFVCSISQRVS